MTSANAFMRSAVYAALLTGLTTLAFESRAQTSDRSDLAAREGDTEATIDRGKMRLTLLITLVENELQEARLLRSRLTDEAIELDQERRALLAGPSQGTQAEQRQLDVIDERLQQIDREMAAVNARLPEIETELDDLNARLDEANGVVRETDTADGMIVDEASRWLDSKRQVQEALVYFGGYNALIDGDFGPRTEEAIRVYQGTQDLPRTGALTDEQEAALLEEADTLRARYGMTTIEDSEIGYRVSYPSGLLPRGETVEPGSRRFLSNDGESELLITASDDNQAKGAADLSVIYDDLLGDYEVQYRRKREDWFVVAGLIEDGRIAYETARLNGDRVIRARLSYPADSRDLWSPFAVIMFNTFEALNPGES